MTKGVDRVAVGSGFSDKELIIRELVG